MSKQKLSDKVQQKKTTLQQNHQLQEETFRQQVELVNRQQDQMQFNQDGTKERNNRELLQKRLRWLTIGIILILLMVSLKLVLHEHVQSVEDFQAYMQRFGVWGPLVLTLIQMLQVVVPILPGYLGCAAGAVAFGPTVGFWCNYIGICVGSIGAYFLARKYGLDVVTLWFPKKQFEKWRKRIAKSKSYSAFFMFAILMPFFPDDFLGYFSGLIKMNKRRFIWMIILGKPWCILAYSIVFGTLL